MDRDPLYNDEYEPDLSDIGNPHVPLENIHCYQCDYLGTPRELTDDAGNID